jgi:hypothetical protein
MNDLDFGRIGSGIAALFTFTWVLAATLWKTARLERRWTNLPD